jgi:FixJ family two-component response regulator
VATERNSAVREETKPTIYIVDDDKSVLKAMKRLIRSMDMDVKTFASGQEFLDSGFKDQNACLIADIKMPVMGGMELQKKVVAKGSKMPVIFITAFDSKNLRSQAKEAGAAGYFQKPVDGQALLDLIQWALSNQVVS